LFFVVRSLLQCVFFALQPHATAAVSTSLRAIRLICSTAAAGLAPDQGFVVLSAIERLDSPVEMEENLNGEPYRSNT
jgi:hypothetical protein